MYDIQQNLRNSKIEVSDNYFELMEKLTLIKTPTMEVYQGGVVSRKNSGLSWISPLCVFKELEGERNLCGVYHLCFVNFNPASPSNETPLLIPFIGCDSGIKCNDQKCTCSERFNKLMAQDYNRPYIILRRSFLSNPAFPYITKYKEFILSEEESMMEDVLEQLSDCGLKFNLQKDLINYTSECLYRKLPILVENSQLTLYGPRVITNEVGTFFSYSVSFNFDLWENYEIIASKPLVVGSMNDLVVRFDSGCDSGQIYDDTACDCRDQFHEALKSIKREEQGIIIHIPSHDGRGYGMAGKMETELYKAGLSGFVHKPKSALDTVQAAELLYGNKYDIRTYSGAALILNLLGISKVRLLTDNADKFKAIQSIGIEVTRIKTNTNKSECNVHIEAKHKTPPYNEDAWATN